MPDPDAGLCQLSEYCNATAGPRAWDHGKGRSYVYRRDGVAAAVPGTGTAVDVDDDFPEQYA